MMLKIIVGNTTLAFNFDCIIRVGVMSRVFPSCCDQKLCWCLTINTTVQITTSNTTQLQGLPYWWSESFCSLLLKYSFQWLLKPTGGSPDVVHLIIKVFKQEDPVCRIMSDNTGITFRGKIGLLFSVCLSSHLFVVSPVKILIFVCEAFYLSIQAKSGHKVWVTSRWCHGHSNVCRPQ